MSGVIRSQFLEHINKEAIIHPTPRINERIRISPVRLIDAEGKQIGIVPLETALAAAEEAGLDLVEVGPNSRPPVVRIMDWGKHLYEKQKAVKLARKKQHSVQIKELKFTLGTEEHDLQFKLRHARKFLADGAKVKIVVRFRGRERSRPDAGHALLDMIVSRLADVAVLESRSANLEGGHLTMLLAPTR